MIKYDEQKERLKEVNFEREEDYNLSKKDAKAIKKVMENNKN